MSEDIALRPLKGSVMFNDAVGRGIGYLTAWICNLRDRMSYQVLNLLAMRKLFISARSIFHFPAKQEVCYYRT